MKSCMNCDHRKKCLEWWREECGLEGREIEDMDDSWGTNCEDWLGWHDLRKNPEDLPEKEKPLLAFVEEQNTYYCAEYELQEFISDEQYAFFEMGTGIELFYQPIAWRYIEPFEEDNE